MNLVKKITDDLLNVRKEKKKKDSAFLSTLLGEVRMVGKNNGNRETTEDEAINTIQKFKKK